MRRFPSNIVLLLSVLLSTVGCSQNLENDLIAATGLVWGQEVELPGKRMTRMSKDAWNLISSGAPPDFHDVNTNFKFQKAVYTLSYIVDDNNRLIGFHGNNLNRGVSILEDFLGNYGPAVETKGLDGGGLERDAYVWSLQENVQVMLVITYIDKAAETSPHLTVDLDKGVKTVERYRAAFTDLVVLKEGQ